MNIESKEMFVDDFNREVCCLLCDKVLGYQQNIEVYEMVCINCKRE